MIIKVFGRIFIPMFCIMVVLNICICFEASAKKDSLNITVTYKHKPKTDKMSELTDGKLSTVRRIAAGSILEIKSDKDIGAIYIIWDCQQVPWTLQYPDKPQPSATETTKTTRTSESTKPSGTTTAATSGTTSTQSTESTETTTAAENIEKQADSISLSEGLGAKSYKSDALITVSGGTNGFLHEYVKITNPGRKLTLTLGESSGAIADIYAFESGRVPGWVQQWNPMLEKADMLLYSCHADDEFLWFGGTLPVYAGEYKKKVQVAYLIRHGNSRDEYIRNHELLDGLWKVGVRNYPMISDFDDYFATSLEQASEIYNEEQVIKYTVMLLRRFKPDVVVGHDPRGEYGHGAHSLCSYSLQKAIPLSKKPAKYRDLADKYGVWDIKKCYLHLYEKNQIVMDWNVPLKAFGGKTGLQMAKEAYKCHRSQADKWFYVQDKGDQYDSRRFGLFYTTVGKDVLKNDFFEHIAPVIPVTSASSSKTLNTSTAATSASVTTSQTSPETTADTVTTSQSPVKSGSENDKNNITVYVISGLILSAGASAAFIVYFFYKKGFFHRQSE